MALKRRSNFFNWQAVTLTKEYGKHASLQHQQPTILFSEVRQFCCILFRRKVLNLISEEKVWDKLSPDDRVTLPFFFALL